MTVSTPLVASTSRAVRWAGADRVWVSLPMKRGPSMSWLRRDHALCQRLQRDGAVGFLDDDPRHEPSLFREDVVEQVIATDDSAGVDGVLEEVVQVGAIGAGQVGADLRALAEESMTLHAG